MAQITINIPDSVAARVLNGFAANYGYQATLVDGTPNPQTKAQFTKAKLIEIIKGAVKAAESQAAVETARIAANQSVDTDITLS